MSFFKHVPGSGRLVDFPPPPPNPDWPRTLLAGYYPRRRWHDEPATHKQVQALVNHGFNPPPGLSKGEAAHALDRARHLPTARQRQLLHRRGLYRDNMTREQAHELIDEIAEQEGWSSHHA
jgi:hypothetical protein